MNALPESAPALYWSREVALPWREGMLSVFQLGTYAVRAEWPDGKVRVRVLKPGMAIRHRNLPNDLDFCAELAQRFQEQQEPVVYEDEE